jgi:hypothetical protein
LAACYGRVLAAEQHKVPSIHSHSTTVTSFHTSVHAAELKVAPGRSTVSAAALDVFSDHADACPNINVTNTRADHLAPC